MALTVTTQAILSVPQAPTPLIIAALVGRKILYIQNYQHMDMFIGFGQDPTETGGLLVRKGDVIEVAAGVPGGGNSTDFYEGAVHIMQFSSKDPLAIYVLEMTA